MSVTQCFKELFEIIRELVVHMSSQVTCKYNIFPPKEDIKNKKIHTNYKTSVKTEQFIT